MNAPLNPSARRTFAAGIALELIRRAGLETVDGTCHRHRDAALPNAGRAGK
jgi:hypothetical protein